MIQRHSSYLKSGITQENPFRGQFVTNNLRLRDAGLDSVAVDLLFMHLGNFKSGSALANTIPVYSPDESHDVVCQSRRAEDAARGEVADSGTQ
jgi:hypothetical protein